MFQVRVLALLIFTLLATAGCNQNSVASGSLLPTSSLTNGPVLPVVAGPNVLPLTVNGSQCSSSSYSNKPCVSITICSTNNGNCQTINDILVDTGSYGLRVFKSVLNSGISLSTISSGGGTLAECVSYADGSSDWGPVETAKVQLGGESAVQVSVQVIDSTFSNSSTYCNGADTGPSSAGFNGILGVGPFAEDCGDGCTTNSSNGVYFSCSGSSCNGAAVGLGQQVTNPVALLPADNNGVVVELPSVPLGGVTSAGGYLILGIGTESNNHPVNVTSYSTDDTGDFSAQYNGQSYVSFLDTGSNGLFVPQGSFPDCGNTDKSFSGFFCPNSTTNQSATIVANSGSPDISVPFQIGNAINLLNSVNNVFVELGGNGGNIVDWGLPFYLGRNVYVGLENTSSSLGTGPYWGF